MLLLNECLISCEYDNIQVQFEFLASVPVPLSTALKIEQILLSLSLGTQ